MSEPTTPQPTSGATTASQTGQGATPPRKQQGDRPQTARTPRTGGSTQADPLLIEMVDMMDRQAAEMKALADKVRAKLGRDTPATVHAQQAEAERNRVVAEGKAGQATPDDVRRVTERADEVIEELRGALREEVDTLNATVFGVKPQDGQPDRPGLVATTQRNQEDLASIRAMLDGDSDRRGVIDTVQSHETRLGHIDDTIFNADGSRKVATIDDLRGLLINDDRTPRYLSREEAVTRTDLANGVHDTVIVERLQHGLRARVNAFNWKLAVIAALAIFGILWIVLSAPNPNMGWEMAWFPAAVVGLFMGLVVGIATGSNEVTFEVITEAADADTPADPDNPDAGQPAQTQVVTTQSSPQPAGTTTTTTVPAAPAAPPAPSRTAPAPANA